MIFGIAKIKSVIVSIDDGYYQFLCKRIFYAEEKERRKVWCFFCVPWVTLFTYINPLLYYNIASGEGAMLLYIHS
jgi:hypothetical protein